MATVARHDSPELSWEMVTHDAHPRLRQHVRNYTGYVERTAKPLRRLEVPSADVTLIISPDTRLSLPDVRDSSRPATRLTSFVAALHDTYALVDHDGFQHGIEVRLTPLGAHSLFGLPMDELTNRVVGLDDLLGRGADELVDRLWDLSGWEPRFRLLDDLIGRRVEAGRPSSYELFWAWRRLRASGGKASVGGLARELGWSHRRLIARFKEQIGMPPKTVARVLRFERVSGRLRQRAAPSLAELALECGYYDQAHLNRDFRDFAGTTPSAYIAARLPEGGGVKSVQDPGSARA
jgi:AraC-like DNA-binding protein